jgi:hypothetical protein
MVGPFQDAAFALPGKRSRYFATHIWFFSDKFCKKGDKFVFFCHIINRAFLFL